ncbi:hypothetical protein HGRIS_006818 [Hohenbuehelia grisea]|uniref:Uncharacterized protein n=1 Tax=Hohenbuehelia grisea TaxID=104357 RepID=A0ABR3JAP8_9AGAR
MPSVYLNNDQNASEYELLPAREGEEVKGYRRGRHWYQRTRSSWLLFAAALLFFFSAVISTGGLIAPVSRLTPSGANEYFDSFISHLWPVGNASRTDNWENENSKSMRALFGCLSQGGCGENQTSVVLLSSFHFANAIEGHTSGEDIWAASLASFILHSDSPSLT